MRVVRRVMRGRVMRMGYPCEGRKSNERGVQCSECSAVNMEVDACSAVHARVVESQSFLLVKVQSFRFISNAYAQWLASLTRGMQL